MQILDGHMLAHVQGGARGQSRQQVNERYQNECTGPDAKKHYETMLAHVKTGGVRPHVVESVRKLCHW